MDKITQLLAKAKELMSEINELKFEDYKDYFEKEICFETAMTDIRMGLQDTEEYLDDLYHGLNGDAFCDSCEEWHTTVKPEDCYLCPECLEIVEQELWQEDESIPYDEL